MAAIASAGSSAINANTQLAVASVTCTGDITARDLTATRELHVDGATVLNGTLTVAGSNVMSAIAAKQNELTASSTLTLSSVIASNGVTITGGRGRSPSAGAQLRLVSTNSILPAAPALF